MIRTSVKTFSAFHKGKLTLQKLRDKAQIDGQVNLVNLIFPDQYGRMHSLKLDADHFLENPEAAFEFNQNPFKNDIAGKAITFEKLQLDDSL